MELPEENEVDLKNDEEKNKNAEGIDVRKNNLKWRRRFAFRKEENALSEVVC